QIPTVPERRLAMNTVTSTTASTTTILAVGLGKYKSVACVHDQAATVKRKRAAWSKGKSQGSDGQHQKEEKKIFSKDGSRLSFRGHSVVRHACRAIRSGHSLQSTRLGTRRGPLILMDLRVHVELLDNSLPRLNSSPRYHHVALSLFRSEGQEDHAQGIACNNLLRNSLRTIP